MSSKKPNAATETLNKNKKAMKEIIIPKSAQTKINTSSKSPKTNQPLKGLICFVEALNSDGTNASEGYITILKNLGADVSESFGDQLTHYICSNCNPKRLIAANALDICVVSPLWVEQCLESNSRANEIDFRLSTPKENIAPSTSAPPMVKEPKVKEVLNRRNLDSPFFSSSQREFEDITQNKPKRGRLVQNVKASNLSKPNPIWQHSSPSGRSVTSSDEDEPTTRPIAIKTKPVPVPIPLPSFKPYIAPVIPAITENRKRRSERISDAYDTDDPEIEELDAVAISEINPNAPLLVVRDDVPTDVPVEKSQAKEKPVASKQKKALNADSKPASSSSIESKKLEQSNKPKSAKSKTTITEEILDNTNFHVISITGFGETGEFSEKSTVSALIAAIIKIISNKKSSSSSSSSGVSPIPPVIGAAGKFISKEEDLYCETTTCLVASESRKRTQRMIFAMSKGVPIVTQSWLYSCLDAGDWVDFEPHLHSCDMSKEDLSKLFRGETFLVGASSDPSPDTLAKLLKIVGAKVTEDISKATCLLFGDPFDGDAWYASLEPALTSGSKSAAMKIAEDCKAYTRKYLYDCIENGKRLKPTREESQMMDPSSRLLVSFSERSKKAIKSKHTPGKPIAKISDFSSKSSDNEPTLKRRKSLAESSSSISTPDKKRKRIEENIPESDEDGDEESNLRRSPRVNKNLPLSTSSASKSSKQELPSEIVALAKTAAKLSSNLKTSSSSLFETSDKPRPEKAKKVPLNTQPPLSQTTAASTLLNLSKNSSKRENTTSVKTLSGAAKVSKTPSEKTSPIVRSKSPLSSETTKKGRLSIRRAAPADDEDFFDDSLPISPTSNGRVGRAESPSW